MKTSPAFQWYPADYLASMRVQMMTLEQEGIYRRLLDYCWLHGSLPSDLTLLKRLIGKDCSNGALEMVITMFQPAGDKLVHDRLDSERRKQANWREKSAEGGRKSAKTRWRKQTDNQQLDKGCSQNGYPNGDNQKVTLQSSVFSLQSSDPLCADAAKELPKKPKERNALLDALASLDCQNLAEVTNWGKHAKALQIIKSVSNDVTPDEIRRRAHNYVRLHPDWALTSTALANNWGGCARVGANGANGHVSQPADIYREPPDWRDRFARKFPDHTAPATWAEVSSTLRNALLQ